MPEWHLGLCFTMRFLSSDILSNHCPLSQGKRRPVTEEIILHRAETEKGSSSASMFDDQWQLIGIHQGFTNELVNSHDSHPSHPRDVFYANYDTSSTS